MHYYHSANLKGFVKSVTDDQDQQLSRDHGSFVCIYIDVCVQSCSATQNHQ